MSECVVRMEMPKDCWYCPMLKKDVFINNICGGSGGKLLQGPLNGRPDWCPIICLLPEGHGRLVDKDEMLKKIENYHRYMTVGRESDPRCIIEDAPTIVPAERSET